MKKQNCEKEEPSGKNLWSVDLSIWAFLEYMDLNPEILTEKRGKIELNLNWPEE